MKIKPRLIIPVVLGLLLVPVLLAPVFIDPAFGPIPTHLKSLSDTRDYYSTVASIVTVIIGLAGLVLGFFYYDNKNRIEGETRQREYIRKRMDLLMAELNTYDKLIHRVSSLSVRDAKDLVEVRSEIYRTFEGIEVMLEQGLELLGLGSEDMKKIMRVNSFVEKCDMLMREDFEKLTVDSLFPIKDRYADLIKEARRACYLKIR